MLAGIGATYLPAPLIVMIGGVITLLTAGVFWRSLPAIRRHIQEHGLIPSDQMTAS
jgi:hypothetical protein